MGENIHQLQRIGFQNLTSVPEAKMRYFTLFQTLPEEEVPIRDAAGRIAAISVFAPIPLPPFTRSMMDGYAIQAEDSFDATPKHPKVMSIIGTIPIGGFPDFFVGRGEVAEIATGAPIPEGANAVVKVEDTQKDGQNLHVLQAVVPGKNIAPIGEDVPERHIILDPGTLIRAEHIGLLSALGFQSVQVNKRPQVCLFSVGDELVSPGDELAPGQIYESNMAMNAVLLEKYGAQVIQQERLPDNQELITAKIQDAANSADLVISSGGTSVGTKDFLPQVMQEVGEVIVHGVAQRPGYPALLSRIGQVPVICLPGFPVACYIGLVTFAGPLVRHLQGAVQLDPRPVVYGTMTQDVPVKGLGVLNHLRVTLEEGDAGYRVTPKKLAGSGVLRSLTESDGFVEVPPDVEGLEEGQLVKVYLHLR